MSLLLELPFAVARIARSIGKVEVTVHQLVKDLAGTVLFDGDVKHVYTVTASLLQQMDIE